MTLIAACRAREKAVVHERAVREESIKLGAGAGWGVWKVAEAGVCRSEGRLCSCVSR